MMFTKEAAVHEVYGPVFEAACFEMQKTAEERDPRDVRAGLFGGLGGIVGSPLSAGIFAGAASEKGHGWNAGVGALGGAALGGAAGQLLGRRIGAPHLMRDFGGALGGASGGYAAHRLSRALEEKKKAEKAASIWFTEKQAKVFGEREPHIADVEVPYETRKNRLLAYAKKKALEGETPLGTALLTGGGVGAGIGALGGALGGGVGGAARGAAGGAVGGALIGALMKAKDNLALARARRLLAPGADIEGEVADRIVAQKRAKEMAREMNAERRHQELLSAHGYGYGHRYY